MVRNIKTKRKALEKLEGVGVGGGGGRQEKRECSQQWPQISPTNPPAPVAGVPNPNSNIPAFLRSSYVLTDAKNNTHMSINSMATERETD